MSLFGPFLFLSNRAIKVVLLIERTYSKCRVIPDQSDEGNITLHKTYLEASHRL